MFGDILDHVEAVRGADGGNGVGEGLAEGGAAEDACVRGERVRDEVNVCLGKLDDGEVRAC